MTKYLDLMISILPIAFAVHNLEEVFGMQKWTNSIPSFFHKPINTRQFSIAVVLFTLLGFGLIWTKNHYHTDKQFLYVVTGFAGMIFLNVFFPHIIATIYLKKYAPGVVTALLINLPLTTSILWAIYKTQKLSIGEMCLCAMIGGIIGVTLAYSFLKFGEIVDNKMKTTNRSHG